MEVRIGENIKGYEFRERIGAGGFGAVYKAYQSTVGREVAIKVILPGHANQPEFVRRFESEAQLVARLEHMHITPLYDYWRDPSGAYLVMRMLRGGSLQDALKKEPFSLEAAALLLDHVASALAVAHRNNIIHRDIKPANILLDEDGNAYLSDFGIAKDLDIEVVSLTSPDALVGSPDYLAPEQARSESVTPQTDIYSLGVVLYEMVSGEHPFPELSPVERLFKHLNDPIPQIKNLEPQIAEAINEVIQKATAKNPTHRFEESMALAKAFREAAALSESIVVENIVELLTPREQEVLKCIIEGKSNREIANELVVELATVKWYVKQIYRKINVRSRVQAIVRAREMNLIMDDWEISSASSTSGISKLPEPENPYKGLCAFQSADELDFFGREKIVKKLLKQLGKTGDFSRFLAVVGPSGSGKSSLVKAGLIPALWRGELPELENLYIVEMLPGTHPLDQLEVALIRVAANPLENLGEQLRRDDRGLIRASQLILPDDGSELLLIIDQFEEIFNLVEDEQARTYFLDLLVTAIMAPRSRVRVVITMRADFYDRPLHYAKFGELIRNRMETVLPMSAMELESAISSPAKRTNVIFEEGLVARIIDDVHYQPGALPLLQYALTELFEVRENRMLTHAGYDLVGGAIGSLGRRSEEIYIEFNEEGQQTVQQMFLRLVTLGEDVEVTRRRVARTELLAITDDDDLMDEIIDTFANYRLLSLDHDLDTRTPMVEVAHEAILSEWERLREWLNESRDDIRLQRQLASTALEWEKANREESYLLRGARLQQISNWVEKSSLALTPEEKEYLDVSKIEREKHEVEEEARKAQEMALEKRAHKLLQVLVSVFFIAAIVSSWFAFQSYQAEQVALKQASIGLAGQARLELVEGLPERAVPLAIEALENYPYTWQAERALFSAVQQNRLSNILKGHDGWIGSAEWSPDGTRLVTTSEDGTARIWNTATWEEEIVLLGHDGEVFTAFWSPDGTRIATAGNDGNAIIWDAATGMILQTLSHSDRITEANWSPNGTAIVTGSYDGTAKVWNAITGELQLILEGHEDFVEVAKWSPDGTLLATASGDGTARIWDSATGKELFLLSSHDDAVIDVSWSPDGTRLASGSFDGTAKVWDIASGEELHTLQGEGLGEIRWVIWSPDGTRILTVERGRNQADGTAAVWDSETGNRQFLLPGKGDLWFAQWSPDGTRIAVNDETANTRIWDSITGAELFILNRRATLGIVSWSPDEALILTGYEDGTLALWDATDIEEFALSGHIPNGIAWSPDGANFARLELGEPAFIVDSASGKTVMTLPDVGTAYNGVSWSPDGTLITTGHTNGTLRIWDAITGTNLHTMQVYEDQVWEPSWSHDSRQLSATGLDGRVHIFDVETGKRLKSLGNPGYGIMLNAVWSPDDSMIAAGNMEGLIIIWDAQTWEEVYRIDVGEWLMGIDWSPDGKQIVASDFLNGQAMVYDVVTGKLQTTFAEHTAPVIYAQFSPDGTRIVTAGEDAVRIWDAKMGSEYAIYEVGAWRVFWSPDGTKLLTSGTDGVVRVWRAFPTTDSLIQFAKDCCIWQELSPDERVIFGLPPEVK